MFLPLRTSDKKSTAQQRGGPLAQRACGHSLHAYHLCLWKETPLYIGHPNHVQTAILLVIRIGGLATNRGGVRDADGGEVLSKLVAEDELKQNVTDTEGDEVDAEDPPHNAVKQKTADENVKEGAADARGEEATGAGEMGVLQHVKLGRADDAGEEGKVHKNDAGADVHVGPHDRPRGVHASAESAEDAEDADDVVEIADGDLHFFYPFCVSLVFLVVC